MKAILASYQSVGWGEVFVLMIFVVAVNFVLLKDSGYWDLIMDTIKIVKKHYRTKRKTRKELRRKVRSLYVREKNLMYKRQICRTKQRIYRLWSPCAERRSVAEIPEQGRESA